MDEYLKITLRLWDFIKKYVINKEYGEWNRRIDKFNNVIIEDDLINFWKTPYHNARPPLVWTVAKPLGRKNTTENESNASRTYLYFFT